MTISAIRRIMLSSFHCGFELLFFPGLQEDSDYDLCDETHYDQLLSCGFVVGPSGLQEDFDDDLNERHNIHLLSVGVC